MKRSTHVTLKHKKKTANEPENRRWHFGIINTILRPEKWWNNNNNCYYIHYTRAHSHTRTHICAGSFFLSPPFLFPARKCKTKQDRCIDITAGELAFFEKCNNNRLPFARMINSSRLAKKQASRRGHKLGTSWCGGNRYASKWCTQWKFQARPK